jgi:ornithine carbamoyltransferase
MKKDFLSLQDYQADDIYQILNFTKEVKKNPGKYANAMKGKELAMIFQKTSTRTRVSFEAGMHQMSGNAIYMDWRTTNFTLGDIQDEIRCLNRYVHLIVARVYHHPDLIQMAQAATVPVINGLSDYGHPCQAIADIFTIEEKFNSVNGKKLVFVGDGSGAVAHSLIAISALLGIELTVATPLECIPSEDLERWIKKIDAKTIHIEENPKRAVKDADILYTDSFVQIGQEEESLRRLPLFHPYQLNMELVQLTGKNPFIMHCLPAHREIEITSEVLDLPNNLAYIQSENRLHTQKALMLMLLFPEKYGFKN